MAGNISEREARAEGKTREARLDKMNIAEGQQTRSLTEESEGGRKKATTDADGEISREGGESKGSRMHTGRRESASEAKTLAVDGPRRGL